MCVQLHGSRARKICSLPSLRCFVICLAFLTTVKGATWVAQPTDKSVTVGQNVTFPCEVNDPTNNLTKVWIKGTTPIFINGVAAGVPSRYTIQGQNTLSIRNVELADDSFYTCSIFTFDNVQVKLTVLVPPGDPSITTNVSNSQFIENSVISLTCSSTGGKPEPTIQWLRNGQLLNSAIYTPPSQEMGTASSQLIVTLQRSDHSANYTCVVFNAANQNQPKSLTRTLNVQYAPSIQFEPNYSPYHVKINSALNLQCVVDANPSHSSIEWFKDGSQLPVSTNIYKVSSIQKSNSGNYTCVARNSIQGIIREARKSVIIDVIYPPIITTQSLVIANVSTQVNMTCQVDANPAATQILWQKLGDDPINANGPNFVFIAQKRYDGNYSCTAYSRLEPSGLPAEDVSSKGTTILKIQYAPGQATIRPISSVLVGQTIMLSCSVDDPGYPYPLYEWRRSDTDSILQSSTSPTYKIESASLVDNGNYTCQPRNLMGQGTVASINVVVNSPPQYVQSNPSDPVLTVPITQANLYLEHQIEGRPKPLVQWFKDGVPVTDTNTIYSVMTTDVMVDNYKYRVTTKLSFVGSGRDQNRLMIEDLGNYTCQAMSADTGSPVTQTTYLSIEFSPQVTASPRVAAEVGEQADMRCMAVANPTPVFYWFRDGQRLTNSTKIALSNQKADGTAMYEGYLKIRSTAQEDFGEYICEVNNAKGQIRKALTLSVKDKPEAPLDLAASQKTWESVKLGWSPGFDGGYPQTFYIDMQSVHGEKTVEVYGGLTSFNVTRLMPATSYTFYVYGRNTLGKGANSEGFTTKTDVLVFPALTEIPKYKVEDKKLEIPNDLSQSYCLRVEVSFDNRKKWTVVEPCVTASDGIVSLAQQGLTDVNVSVCLVYRPEVCGEPVMSEIHEPNTPDLTETQVIIIGCVCAAILIVLLVILICIIWRRRQRNKNYTNDPHSPRTVQQGNGAIPNQKPRAYDNTDGIHLDNRNGYPVPYISSPTEYPMGDMSYDSQMYDKQYEYEMNRRNANMNGDQYYHDKPSDMSFNGSPRTPTKDSQQFIGLPEEHTKEGGSFGSGNESGYSTPDKAKPKKKSTMNFSMLFNINNNKKEKKLATNPDLVPYSHNPPGHTCGLPCCSKDLQVQLRRNRPPRSCIGIQDIDAVAQNFTFKGRLKQTPGLENGFFSVQETKEVPHAAIPKFGTINGGLPPIKENTVMYPFLKGREITLPEVKDCLMTEKLYLEGYDIGESDDFLDFDMTNDCSGETLTDNEIKYYVKSQNQSSFTKGVPYNPTDLENMQIFPWGQENVIKDAVSTKSFKDDCSSTSDYYSSGSNYYEVLRLPDEKSLSDKEIVEKMGTSVVPQDVREKSKSLPCLPTVPPKPPKQTMYNHPPLHKVEKPETSESVNKVPEKESDLQTTSDSDSSCTIYNTYSSVYSLTCMGNKMSKEAYEKFLERNRNQSTKSLHRDIRDLSFTGDDLPLTNRSLDLAATKSRLNQILKDRKTVSMPRKFTDIKEVNEDPVVPYEEDLCKISLSGNQEFKSEFRGTDSDLKSSERTDKILCSGQSMGTNDKMVSLGLSKSLNDLDNDSDDEIDGELNLAFKGVNVDGKFVGSRNPLNRQQSFSEELRDRFLHLWGEYNDHGSVNEDEKKVVKLLKERLRDIDESEGASGESFNDNPITLIL